MAGIATRAAVGAIREVGKGYYNQTAALFLDRLSKASPDLSKYGKALAKYASEGPQAFSSALYVLVKDNEEFKKFLSENPPPGPSQPEKLQAREEEAGLEEEGFFDVLKPYKNAILSKSEMSPELQSLADLMLRDGPSLAMMKNVKMDMGDVYDFKKSKAALERGLRPEAEIDRQAVVKKARKPESVLNSIRNRLDDGPEYQSTHRWLDRVEKDGADEPYVGLDYAKVAALRGPKKTDPIQPIPVPLEKIGDLGGVLGKGVLKGESDPFGWMDT